MDEYNFIYIISKLFCLSGCLGQLKARITCYSVTKFLF